MKLRDRRTFHVLAVLVALILLAGLGQWFFGNAVEAQAPQKPAAGAPIFEEDPSWLKMPEKYAVGELSSVAVDEQDHVWMLQRPKTIPAEKKAMAAAAVLEFGPAGNFIQTWGGPGNGYEWPEREHGIHVDYKGNVWIGGINCRTGDLPGLKPVSDDQLLKFTKAGKFLLQIGRSNMSTGNDDTKNLHEPADAFVYAKTNEVFVADGYGNHRVIVFDADTGAFKRMWGAFGNKPLDNDRCPLGRVAPQDLEGNGPPQFIDVHGARVSNDGMVYVADRENRRVQVFTIDGKYVNQIVAGRKRPDGGILTSPGGIAFSPDAQQEFLYAAGNQGILILRRKTLQSVGSINATFAHHIATDSKGNVFVAQISRVSKFVFKGSSPAVGQ